MTGSGLTVIEADVQETEDVPQEPKRVWVSADAFNLRIPQAVARAIEDASPSEVWGFEIFGRPDDGVFELLAVDGKVSPDTRSLASNEYGKRYVHCTGLCSALHMYARDNDVLDIPDFEDTEPLSCPAVIDPSIGDAGGLRVFAPEPPEVEPDPEPEPTSTGNGWGVLGYKHECQRCGTQAATVLKLLEHRAMGCNPPDRSVFQSERRRIAFDKILENPLSSRRELARSAMGIKKSVRPTEPDFRRVRDRMLAETVETEEEARVLFETLPERKQKTILFYALEPGASHHRSSQFTGQNNDHGTSISRTAFGSLITMIADLGFPEWALSVAGDDWPAEHQSRIEVE